MSSKTSEAFWQGYAEALDFVKKNVKNFANVRQVAEFIDTAIEMLPQNKK